MVTTIQHPPPNIRQHEKSQIPFLATAPTAANPN